MGRVSTGLASQATSATSGVSDVLLCTLKAVPSRRIPEGGVAKAASRVDNDSMDCSHLNRRRTRPHTACRCAWASSLLLHGLAAAAAWAVTSPWQYEPSELIGQSTHIELTATMSQSEFTRREPAPEEQAALPVRIMPSEARIARQHFRVESTSVSEPTPLEREWVERMLARPNEARPARDPHEPTMQSQPPGALARRPASLPVPNRPGTVDRPLPELIQSMPPTYPQSAIERRWEGTVLLRLDITDKGRVGRVEIIQSSGHAVLDGEAARAVRTWRFVPAVRDGHSVASSVRLPVRFELSN